MGSKFQRFFSSAKMLKLQSWVLELEDHHQITQKQQSLDLASLCALFGMVK